MPHKILMTSIGIQKATVTLTVLIWRRSYSSSCAESDCYRRKESRRQNVSENGEIYEIIKSDFLTDDGHWDDHRNVANVESGIDKSDCFFWPVEFYRLVRIFFGAFWFYDF